MTNLQDKFWEKVEIRNKKECWPWIGRKDKAGYGRAELVRSGRKIILAHRLAYQLANNIIPEQDVLHICDNRACVNPSHLYLGTHQDNMRDRTLRGRTNSKLNKWQVLRIRLLSEIKIPQWRIAEIFSVDKSNISLIVRRKRWQHLI